MRRADFTILLVALLALCGPRVARAELPADHQARLMLRILAYDQRLGIRAKGTVTVVVLERSGHPGSKAAAAAMIASLDSLRRQVSIAGLPLRVVPIEARDVVTAAAELGRVAAVAVYICPGWSDQLGSLAIATRRLSVLSFAEREPERHGEFAIGLVQRGSRPAIVVDLPAALAEGARLDAGLLQIAEVRR